MAGGCGEPGPEHDDVDPRAGRAARGDLPGTRGVAAWSPPEVDPRPRGRRRSRQRVVHPPRGGDPGGPCPAGPAGMAAPGRDEPGRESGASEHRRVARAARACWIVMSRRRPRMRSSGGNATRPSARRWRRWVARTGRSWSWPRAATVPRRSPGSSASRARRREPGCAGRGAGSGLDSRSPASGCDPAAASPRWRRRATDVGGAGAPIIAGSWMPLAARRSSRGRRSSTGSLRPLRGPPPARRGR